MDKFSSYQTFRTFAEAIEHVRTFRHIHYHAPMDYQPRWVNAEVECGVIMIKTWPRSFIADEGHLPRLKFKKGDLPGG